MVVRLIIIIVHLYIHVPINIFFIGVGIQGYCEVLNGIINELNLTKANVSIPEEPENLVLPNDYVRPNDSLSYYSRRKRSLDYTVPFETTERAGVKRKVIVLVSVKICRI